MYILPVAIPSYNLRAKNILDNPTLKNAIIFIWKEEERLYKEKYPQFEYVVFEPTRKRCIQEKRARAQAYLEEMNIHKYWMFDDDFKNFRTVESNWKEFTTDLNYLENWEHLLDEYPVACFDLGGFCKITNRNTPKPCTMFSGFFGVNTQLCKSRFKNEDVFEDLDLCYRIIDEGKQIIKIPTTVNSYYRTNGKHSTIKYDKLSYNTFMKYGDRCRIRKDSQGRIRISGGKKTKVKEGYYWNKLKDVSFDNFFEELEKAYLTKR